MTFPIANLLSILRLCLVPGLLIAAGSGARNAFLLLLAVALTTDALDGFCARKFGQTSALGARLDSWGDLAVFFAVPVAIWLLWPDLLRREALYVTIAVVSFVIPLLAGLWRFRRLTSYHTWGAKTTAVALSVTTLLLLLNGPALPFRIAVILLVLTAIEEICITAVLPEWQADVPSLWHAFAIRRQHN